MPVTKDQVLWAYRNLLGREPEDEAALRGHLDFEDVAALHAHFVAGAEFRSRQEPWLRVGRFVDQDRIDVEVECSEADLRRMMDRISREWIRFGEQDPHWSVLTTEEFSSANITANEDAFYATASNDIRQVLSMIQRNRPGFIVDRALDFGCGVGRLSLMLAPHVGHVTGVDISPPHAALASDRAIRVGIGNADFRVINSFEGLRTLKDFDLVMSVIVLQHNPSPVMAELLRILLSALRVGGVAAIQVPTYLHERPFSVASYFADEQPAMEMHALPQSVVFDIADKAGCLPLEVREDCRIGEGGLSHIFLFERRR